MPLANEQASAKYVGLRRHLTLLFADLSESTRISDGMEAEHFAAVLDTLKEIWREVVSKHGGRIARMQGDGALAVFGYPEAREDDGRRAAEAALEIHERVKATSTVGLPTEMVALEMHSGIHCGLVLLSEGDLERGRFELVGDVPNTAARLSDIAQRGEILASEESLGPHVNFFELGKAMSVTLPGRSAALNVIPVLCRAAVPRRFDAGAKRGLTPFVGRQETLAAIRSLLRKREAETPRCALILGGPGIGKTRLLEELAAQPEAAAMVALRGYCESYLGAEILQPFLQMLRTYCGIKPGMATAEATRAVHERTAHILSVLPGGSEPLLRALAIESSSINPTGARGGVVSDLASVFNALAAHRPVLLFIDDWQWADDASRQLLESLLQLKRDLVVLLASRPRDDGAEWIAGSLQFALSPFGETETSHTVRRWLPGADPFLVTEIHRYAGGVPLFIEELCHSVAAGAQWRSPQGKSSNTAWLASLVASRVGRLPASQAEVVQSAAVIGNVFPAWLLERVIGRQQGDPDVRALADSDFIFPADHEGMLRFKHGITRDAVYETVGLHQRTAIHLQVVSALADRAGDSEREDALEALAYHSGAAGLWDRASRYAELAGDKATAAFALDRARAQYMAAMDALDRVHPLSREDNLRWCSIAHKLGMTCIFDPLSLTDGIAIFERCVSRARGIGEANAIARSEYWLGYMCYGLGRARRGEAHCRQALRLATDSGDLRLAAQVRATLGQVLAATCEYDEAIQMLDSAIDSKRRRGRPGSGVAIGSAYALACEGSVLGDRGSFRAAHQCFAEAMELLSSSTHPVANSVRNWICVVHIWQGEWDAAQRIAAESVRIAENTRALLLLAMSRAVGGYAGWAASGSAAALDQLREALHWIEQRRGAFFTSLHYGWLVEGCVAQGRTEEARRHAARLLLRAREHERLGEAVGCRALARAAVASGDVSSAERYLRRAEASARLRASPRESALNLVSRAQVAAHQGNESVARALIAEASADLEAMEMRWHLERTKHLLEEIGSRV